jgi:hypothetical protein
MGDLERALAGVLVAFGTTSVLAITFVVLIALAIARFHRRERERGVAGLRRLNRAHSTALGIVWMGALVSVAWAPLTADTPRDWVAVRAEARRAPLPRALRVSRTVLPGEEQGLIGLPYAYSNRSQGGVVLEDAHVVWFSSPTESWVFVLEGAPGQGAAIVRRRIHIDGRVIEGVETRDGFALAYRAWGGTARELSLAFYANDGSVLSVREHPVASIHHVRLAAYGDSVFIASAAGAGHRVRVDVVGRGAAARTILAEEIPPYRYHPVEIAVTPTRILLVAPQQDDFAGDAWAIDLAGAELEAVPFAERVRGVGTVRLTGMALALMFTLWIVWRVVRANRASGSVGVSRATYRAVEERVEDPEERERARHTRIGGGLLYAWVAVMLLMPAILAPLWDAFFASLPQR